MTPSLLITSQTLLLQLLIKDSDGLAVKRIVEKVDYDFFHSF